MRMAAAFDSASITLKKNEPPVALIKVDCTVEKLTCAKYEVRGYPTLKIFRNGEFVQVYKGTRDTDGIIGAMINKTLPSAKQLNKQTEILKYFDDEKHTIIGYFNEKSTKLINEFEKAAQFLDEKYKFAYTTNNDLLKESGKEE
jgi:protein disulfide-isomerase A3